MQPVADRREDIMTERLLTRADLEQMAAATVSMDPRCPNPSGRRTHPPRVP
jgi:hypothetical protein